MTNFATVLKKEEQKLTGIDWMKIALTCPTCNSNDLRLQPPHKQTWCVVCMQYKTPLTDVAGEALNNKRYLDKAWLVYQYVTLHRSTREICDELHVTTQTIAFYLKSYGVKLRGRWIKKESE